MNGVYYEFIQYSPIHDCEVARLTVFDARGAEYFVLLPITTSNRYRHAKIAALDAISETMERGDKPGEVKLPKNEFDVAVAQVAAEETAKKRSEEAKYGRQ